MARTLNSTIHAQDPPAAALLRSPDTVMRLARLGSFHQTRLSFMRVLLRRLARENWQVVLGRWEIDGKGRGFAVYEARGNGRVYSLVAFSHELDPAKRTDRVIAEEWDATFALHDGVASPDDIDRLSRNVPRQEAGRFSAAEIVIARANKSVRLFDHVVSRLAAGLQPEAGELDAVGYLMRTTAVYGSGKFGLAVHQAIAARPEFAGPFSAEMLTVWLIRAFTVDLVEHMARVRSPKTAVRLDRNLRRRLGVGNSTGLGMAPFVVNHPGLFDRWISARETALARVRSLDFATEQEVSVFLDRLERGRAQVAAWQVDDVIQATRIEDLARDLGRLSDHVDGVDLSASLPWDRLYRFAEENLCLEAQEFLISLLLEPYGPIVDDLAETMAGDESADFPIDGAVTLEAIAARIDAAYRYALAIDFEAPEAQARFWYVSEEKLEPRLGERAVEEGAEREQPLAIARDVAALRHALRDYPVDAAVATFLVDRPEFRHVVRRVQLSERRPYAEVRDNLIDASLRPIDLLRCKLSFFGATDFDPRSDRWVRIALFRHAPFPDELHKIPADDWAIPPIEPVADRAAGIERAPARFDPFVSPDIVENGFSLNEIEAQIRKAARGAGIAWGLADEAGGCARMLAAAYPETLRALADVLEAQLAGEWAKTIVTDSLVWQSPDRRPLDPLLLGPAIADHAFVLARGILHVNGPVVAPVLLLPFVASAADKLQQPLLFKAGGVQVTVVKDNLSAAVRAISTMAVANDLELSLAPASEPVRASAAEPVRGSVAVPGELWARFEVLAALTYVPSSEKSRTTGAGAGLNDND